ncbi:tripartite tricarboxylate transporter substrate binding protein [Siccirubricoccus sp. G192]|uniref:Bug family tripartite tricarboxylate transporter substrate binding protein n=1 Tax=Siccirubricoccus sp. G192 TaxID=2849651 RepID=UPI001C2B896F|nr:tripartite tricarboxylate transporter substrate-binding protein [Siccirubricoccus sp. G192]MBV1796163.1 tripartite tricarboxylate transporter substrate binding protein [Siccirubricoccus sp. G192]
MTTATRRAMLGLAAGLLPFTRAGAQGGPQAPNTFPDRGLRYIVPFTPAGLTDIMARLVAQKLTQTWSQPVVVDNRPGGNGLIGADAAAKAPADGHTLLAITLTHAVNVSLFPNAPYNLRRDFAPVSVLGSLPLVVCVNPSNPARSLGDLLEQAKTRQMNGGSSGNGSPPHLALELFRRVAGAGPNLVHVPYRGGAPGVTDLVAGNLDVLISNLPECIGQLKSGRLRGLAITDTRRHKLVPEIPTVHEAGAPGLEITNWTAILTNAAVPRPVFQKIERDTLAAIRDPEVVRRAEEGGFDVLGWDAARSREYIDGQVERWSRLVAEAGIKVD